MMLRNLMLVCSSTLCLAVCLPATGRSADEPDRLNILLFTADDLHAESLGAFRGRVKDLTPNLDRFAKQGMLFDRAHVNAAICVPSRAVIATAFMNPIAPLR